MRPLPFLLSVVLLLLFPISVRAAAYEKLHDLVIVGGGLAGLSAAHELKAYDAVLLEKDGHLGGRILTREKDGIPYELGAVFRYEDPSIFSAGGLPPYAIEKGGFGIYYKGKVFSCDDVTGCISRLGLEQRELAEIFDFRDHRYSEDLPHSDGLSQRPYEVLNAFFRIIHPGEMRDYVYARQRDAFVRWPVEYYAAGNALVISTLKQGITARVELKAEVVSVDDLGKFVVTTYRQGGRIRKVFSKAVIITPPAPVAKKIIRRIGPEASSFLNTVKYGQFTVVVVGLKDVNFTKFSYLVPVDLLCTGVVLRHFEDKKVTVLMLYYGDKESRQQSHEPDATVIGRAVDIIHKLNIGRFSEDNILFTDIKRWEHGGTIIEPPLFKDDPSGNYARPSRRVFLAGDYVYRDNFFPYGMIPAVLSGQITARKVQEMFNE